MDNRVDVNEKKLHLLKRKKKDVNDQKMQTTKSCVFLKRGKMKEKGVLRPFSTKVKSLDDHRIMGLPYM